MYGKTLLYHNIAKEQQYNKMLASSVVPIVLLFAFSWCGSFASTAKELAVFVELVPDESSARSECSIAFQQEVTSNLPDWVAHGVLLQSGKFVSLSKGQVSLELASNNDSVPLHRRGLRRAGPQEPQTQLEIIPERRDLQICRISCACPKCCQYGLYCRDVCNLCCNLCGNAAMANTGTLTITAANSTGTNSTGVRELLSTLDSAKEEADFEFGVSYGVQNTARKWAADHDKLGCLGNPQKLKASVTFWMKIE